MVERARRIASSPDLRDRLYLVSQGVPFDVAFTLSDDHRLAWCVILGELGGRGHFDWSNGKWGTVA